MSAQAPLTVVAAPFTGSGPAQQTQLVRLVDRETGEVIERLPGIAREIVALNKGRFVLEGEAPSPESHGAAKPAALPKIAQLADAIAALDKDAVEALQATDNRPSAVPIYAARLAALAAEPPGA